MFGRKQRTIDALRRRVDDLEERLCPCGAHEWVDTGVAEYCSDGYGISVSALHLYRCKRCGKVRLNWR